MAKTLIQAVNTLKPNVTDNISFGGDVVDLTGSTVTFFMRPVDGTTIKATGAAGITDQHNGGVQYEWQSGDTDTQGVFAAWWRVNFVGGKTQDSDEFLIIFDSHAPGKGVLTGVLADRVRAKIPLAYDELKNDTRYGEPLLQSNIELAKFTLFNTIVSASLEATAYNPLIQDYIAKSAVVRIIPGAVDYFTSKPISISTSGTNESASYPDRIQNLWRIHERMIQEVKSERNIFELTCSQTGVKFATRQSALDTPHVHNVNPRATFDANAVGGLYATVWSPTEQVNTWH